MKENMLAVKKMLFIMLVGAFIGFLSPFGMDAFPWHVSVLYWVIVCVLGYGVYYPIIKWVDVKLTSSTLSPEAKISIAVFPAGLLFSLCLPALNGFVFEQHLDYWYGFQQTLLPTFVIGSAITFVSYLKNKSTEQTQAISETNKAIEQQQREKMDRLLNQLPLEKRGELMCLEMDDHYLNVHTDKGNHLILMRFKDALALLSHYPGIQTHRSWWVADSAIRTSGSENRKLRLVLNNDLQVPVSKTYLQAVKARYSI